MELNVKAFALAFGIVWGGGLFILTWWLIATEGITGEALFIGRVYPGYSVSALGSLAGLVWGFIDGCIGGALLAWIYNILARRL